MGYSAAAPSSSGWVRECTVVKLPDCTKEQCYGVQPRSSGRSSRERTDVYSMGPTGKFLSRIQSPQREWKHCLDHRHVHPSINLVLERSTGGKSEARARSHAPVGTELLQFFELISVHMLLL